MAHRILAIACSIVIGLLGLVAIAFVPECAWWRENEPIVSALSYDVCMSLAVSQCVDPAEAQAICKLAQTAEDATRQLSTRAALVCAIDAGRD